eukprot:1056673-Amphidinium_carterae.1
MDPSEAELEAIGKSDSPLDAAVAWTGLSGAVLKALREETGNFTKIRELVFMPLPQWQRAVEAAR